MSIVIVRSTLQLHASQLTELLKLLLSSVVDPLVDLASFEAHELGNFSDALSAPFVVFLVL